jgi:hypothetical protein
MNDTGHYVCSTAPAAPGERLIDRFDRRLVREFGKREQPVQWIGSDEAADVDEIDERD